MKEKWKEKGDRMEQQPEEQAEFVFGGVSFRCKSRPAAKSCNSEVRRLRGSLNDVCCIATPSRGPVRKAMVKDCSVVFKHPALEIFFAPATVTHGGVI